MMDFGRVVMQSGKRADEHRIKVLESDTAQAREAFHPSVIGGLVADVWER